MREELFITGIGGQGIILAGELIAKAAMEKGYYAVMTKIYGAEVRGGASSSGVIISDNKIFFPFVRRPDYILALHEKGLRSHAPRNTKILIIDEDLVRSLPNISYERLVKLPLIRIAESIGASILANMVLLGIYSAFSRSISVEDLKKVIISEVKEKYKELNLRALEKGYEIGKKVAHS